MARRNRPTPEMLRGIDALVFDIQDAGVHFYTYETTMAYAMEAAAKANIPFFVLDRPNPVSGVRVEGPLLDTANESFVGYFGGLAGASRHDDGRAREALQCRAQSRRRSQSDSDGGLASRRLVRCDRPPLDQPLAEYAQSESGVALSRVSACWNTPRSSVGRGTDSPFEQLGADFINGRELAGYLNARQIPGVRVYPTSFTPTESNFKGVRIEGVRFEIVDREMLDATRLGLEVAGAIAKAIPREDRLVGG